MCIVFASMPPAVSRPVRPVLPCYLFIGSVYSLSLLRPFLRFLCAFCRVFFCAVRQQDCQRIPGRVSPPPCRGAFIGSSANLHTIKKCPYSIIQKNRNHIAIMLFPSDPLPIRSHCLGVNRCWPYCLPFQASGVPSPGLSSCGMWK